MKEELFTYDEVMSMLYDSKQLGDVLALYIENETLELMIHILNDRIIEFIDCFRILKESDEELDKIRYNVIISKAKEIFGKELTI